MLSQQAQVETACGILQALCVSLLMVVCQLSNIHLSIQHCCHIQHFQYILTTKVEHSRCSLSHVPFSPPLSFAFFVTYPHWFQLYSHSYFVSFSTSTLFSLSLLLGSFLKLFRIDRQNNNQRQEWIHSFLTDMNIQCKQCSFMHGSHLLLEGSFDMSVHSIILRWPDIRLTLLRKVCQHSSNDLTSNSSSVCLIRILRYAAFRFHETCFYFNLTCIKAFRKLW